MAKNYFKKWPNCPSSNIRFFLLKRQNQLAELTVMVPMNIDGDTRRLLTSFVTKDESIESWLSMPNPSNVMEHKEMLI